jgi:hypothetical protein
MVWSNPQRWELTVHGHQHRVEARGPVLRTIRWYVDDVPVAARRTLKGDVSLEAENGTGQVVELQSDALGRATGATLFDRGDVEPARRGDVLSTVGIDLDPEPGSPAARREQRIREHPWRHAMIATVGGLARVVVPLLLGLLAVRLAIAVPVPHWNVPWPHVQLPRVPWPDVSWPEIPWPDVEPPAWQVPDWLRWVARTMRYGWPVLLALVLAKLEVDRRREQDALKAELSAGTDPATLPSRTRGLPADGPSAATSQGAVHKDD